MAASVERQVSAVNGWTGLIGLVLVAAAGGAGVWVGTSTVSVPVGVAITAVGALALAAAAYGLTGLMVLPPNMAAVLVLFGRYVGTVREEGFYWVNPFTNRTRMSLRARNLGSDTIKVNDLDGNPIEIAVVTVWDVRDTAQACFDVDDLGSYVDVQIESAVREIAGGHPYDEREDHDVVSLRSDAHVVADELVEELSARLQRAGVGVIEARITHLAYAPEIAGAMLQRQQASAIVAARREIVNGAVSMVEQTLTDLADKQIVELEPVEAARLAGRLLVVLCGQQAAQPVIHAG
ncbi:MAG: regulator of protease activity HflC (stomatin/prohibitin superfamily) [Myxococcota bacterium]|jgi:regulator of protease activity HflC (stomatin/prohibitin superfamily)